MTSTQHLCGLCVAMTYCVIQWLYVRRTVVLSGVLGLLSAMALCGGKDIVGHAIADWTQAAGVDTLAALVCLIGSAVTLSRRPTTAILDDPGVGTAATSFSAIDVASTDEHPLKSRRTTA